MTPVLNQIDLLKELLKKFVDILYIDDMELERMNDYIFSSAPDVLFGADDDSELYDTLDFLKNLAFDGDFINAGQLLHYFSEQAAIIDNKIEEERQLIARNLPTVSWAPDFLSQFTQSIKLLACSGQHIKPARENLILDLHELVASNADIEKLEGSYKEVGRFKVLLYACSRKESILPNSDHLHFENYYRSFTPSGKPYTKVISMLKRVRDFFSRAAWKRKGKQSSKIENLYKRIFQNIRMEQRIEGDEMKRMLSRIMLIAKLNNPSFRARHKTTVESQNIKLHSEDFDSLFMLNRKYYQCFNKKKWAILKSPAGHCWNTTDNPGFSIDMRDGGIGHTGIMPDPYWSNMVDESLVYFPLSQEYCLRLAPAACQVAYTSQHESAIEFEQSTEQELRAVNKLSIAARPDVVISPYDGIRKRVSNEVCCAGDRN